MNDLFPTEMSRIFPEPWRLEDVRDLPQTPEQESNWSPSFPSGENASIEMPQMVVSPPNPNRAAPVIDPEGTHSPRVVGFSPVMARSGLGLTVSSLYNRYEQENGVIKSTKRKDFYCATVWFPFFLREYHSEMSQFRRFLFSLHVYSSFVFVAIAGNLFSVLVFGELVGEISCQPVQITNLHWLASWMASVLFILSLFTEFKLSMEPLLFWWRIVQFGDWEFKISKNDDTSIELVKVSAPKWNSILRLVVVGGTQIISSLVVLIVGLLTIQSSTNFRDLVKDCLALIWISQIDEIVFQFLFLFNSYFKSLWRDEIFEETVYLYRSESIKRESRPKHMTSIKHAFTSLYGVGLLVLLFGIASQLVIQYAHCRDTPTRTPMGEPNSPSLVAPPLTPANS
jgi:hypothetical protein